MEWPNGEKTTPEEVQEAFEDGLITLEELDSIENSQSPQIQSGLSEYVEPYIQTTVIEWVDLVSHKTNYPTS